MSIRKMRDQISIACWRSPRAAASSPCRRRFAISSLASGSAGSARRGLGRLDVSAAVESIDGRRVGTSVAGAGRRLRGGSLQRSRRGPELPPRSNVRRSPCRREVRRVERVADDRSGPVEVAHAGRRGTTVPAGSSSDSESRRQASEPAVERPRAPASAARTGSGMLDRLRVAGIRRTRRPPPAGGGACRAGRSSSATAGCSGSRARICSSSVRASSGRLRLESRQRPLPAPPRTAAAASFLLLRLLEDLAGVLVARAATAGPARPPRSRRRSRARCSSRRRARGAVGLRRGDALLARRRRGHDRPRAR